MADDYLLADNPVGATESQGMGGNLEQFAPRQSSPTQADISRSATSPVSGNTRLKALGFASLAGWKEAVKRAKESGIPGAVDVLLKDMDEKSIDELATEVAAEQPGRTPEDKNKQLLQQIEKSRVKEEKTPSPRLDSMTGTMQDLKFSGIADVLKSEENEVEIIQNRISRWKKNRNLLSSIDLTPLLSLADSWSGGDSVRAYKPPKTKEERDEAMQELQEKLAQRQTDLAYKRANLQRLISGEDEKSYNVLNQAREKNWDIWRGDVLNMLTAKESTFPLDPAEKRNIATAKYLPGGLVNAPAVGRLRDEFYRTAEKWQAKGIPSDESYRYAMLEMEGKYLKSIKRE